MGRRPPTLEASSYRKLSKEENRRLGFSEGSKRFVLKGTTPTATNTISGRKQHEIALSQRLGQKTSKEQFTKKIATGEAKYRNTQTAERQANAAIARSIRSIVPEMTRKDMQIAIQWEKKGYNRLDDKQKTDFRQLFKTYVADDVRQAFGSAPRDTGAFPAAV